MPLITQLIEDTYGVIHTGIGCVQEHEIIEAVNSMMDRCSGGNSVQYIVFNFEYIDKMSVSSHAVKQVAYMNMIHANATGSIPVAVIARSDHTYGMARMWEAYVKKSGWNIRILRCGSDAKVWLEEQHGIKIDLEGYDC